MKENVIISLADSNYYDLLDELVDSVKRFKESENIAICILDAGLKDDQKQKLSKKVDDIKFADWDIDVPDFKVRGREWLKSQVSRAFLPKYFPGYKKYLWIDADAWVNSWSSINLYFKGCENNKLSIATSADRAYGRVLRAEWVFGSFARIKSQNYKHAKSSGFSERIAREVALKPHLNIGVFALEANASHWEVWQKNLRKAKSSPFPQINKFHANVQNVYKKQYGDSILVAANSLPSYQDRPLVATKSSKVFSGTFLGETLNITDHGFYSGDAVYYTPQKVVNTVAAGDGETVEETTITSSLFGGETGGEGVYYVQRIDHDNIKLGKSPANLYSSQFVSIETTTTVTDNILDQYDLRLKSLEPQKLYREISTPINTNVEVKTKPGATGILVNGVEILNYKSKDIIHAGKVESVQVTAPGNGFDVINPPKLNISDPVGTGATGFLAINGSLRELQILERGFDFTEVPTVSIFLCQPSI